MENQDNIATKTNLEKMRCRYRIAWTICILLTFITFIGLIVVARSMPLNDNGFFDIKAMNARCLFILFLFVLMFFVPGYAACYYSIMIDKCDPNYLDNTIKQQEEMVSQAKEKYDAAMAEYNAAMAELDRLQKEKAAKGSPSQD